MSIDEILAAYRDGLFNDEELFGWLTTVLLADPGQLQAALVALDFETPLREGFREWLGHLRPETEILHQDEILRPTSALLSAIALHVGVPGEPRQGLIELDVELPAGPSVRTAFNGQVVRRGTGPKWAVRATVITRYSGGSGRIRAASIVLLNPDAPPFEVGEDLRLFSDTGEVGPARVIEALGGGLRHDRGLETRVG